MAFCRFRLPPHIYVCQAQDHPVLMDLRRNSYIGISNRDGAILSSLVEGWPRPPLLQLTPCDESTLPSAANDLLASGILTENCHESRDATPIAVPEPAESLLDGYSDEALCWHGSARDILRFSRSLLSGARAVRFGMLEAFAARVRHRKACLNSPTAAMARSFLSTFLLCRPFFYTARDACLLDSLILVDFLSRSGVSATCVIGVKTGPFGAHAWVQLGRYVLNDTPGFVRHYVPIFSI